MKVTKRNGTEVDFDIKKIENAINKASNECEIDERVTPEIMDAILNRIFKSLEGKSIVSIEEIQDMVETNLMKFNCGVVAKAYIRYRYNRELVRKANTTDEAILGLVANTNKDAMEENSNKNAYLASTQRDLIAGEVSRDLTKRVLLPKKISEAHENGILHFHDADYFVNPITNCCLINIQDMLDNGTVMNGKMIESPKSFQVACTVTTQIIAAVASSQYGLMTAV